MTIFNESTIISVGAFQTCIQIVANEDEFVEGDEGFTVFVELTDPDDVVGTNGTLITITDNDGEDVSIVMHQYNNYYATRV